MEKSNGAEAIRLSARWDRAAVTTGEGATHLVVRVTTSEAPRGERERPAMDLALVLDRSGSMSGEPLELAKVAVRQALDLLTPDDRVALVAYDHAVQRLAPLSPLTGPHVSRLKATVAAMEPGGSTDLFGGWLAGCELLAEHPRRSHERTRVQRTLLLTDGQANVGVTSAGELSHHAGQLRMRGISTSTLGLGAGIDEEILASMAEAGGGNFQLATQAHELPAIFRTELADVLATVAVETVVTLRLPKRARARLLNPYPVERDGKELTISLGAMPAGMTLNLVFEVTTRFAETGAAGAFALEASWIDAATRMPEQARAETPALVIVAPTELERTPWHPGAAEAVAHTRAELAKREAIRHFREGNRQAGSHQLHEARSYLMSAPVPDASHIADGLDEVAQADVDSAAFAERRRKLVHDAHKLNRGRKES